MPERVGPFTGVWYTFCMSDGKIKIELRKMDKDGLTYYMGNSRLPVMLDMSNLVFFVRETGQEHLEMTIEKYAQDPKRGGRRRDG